MAFNSGAVFGFPVRVGGQLHYVAVNFPDDDQWGERARARPMVIHTLSGGQQKWEMPQSSEFDLRLYQKIRQGCCQNGNSSGAEHGAPDLDEFEATSLIEKLATNSVRNVTLGAADCEVELDVMVFETQHKLAIPTQRQIVEYRKRSHDEVNLPYGRQRMRIFPEAGGRLYDELLIEKRNYEGTVSVLHKHAVVVAVINALENEGSQPNFH